MRVDRLVVASKNPDKIREVEEVLGRLGLAEVVRGLDWPDVEETGETLEENAVLKARAVAAATGMPALADDTGLEVEALGGAPGVWTARYAGEGASYADNVAKLLVDVEEAEDRRARFVTVVALVTPEGEAVTAEGVLEGTITTEPRGDAGFGYDPIFAVGGRTLAEMTAEEKHAISHRARALRALAERLRAGEGADRP